MPILETVRVSIVLPASAERLYRALLDSRELSAATSAPASVSARIGGKITLLGGKLAGKIAALESDLRVELSLAEEGAEPSKIEIHLAPASGGTRVTWAEEVEKEEVARVRSRIRREIFEPMQAHFRAPDTNATSSPPASRRVVTKAAAKPRKRG